MFIVGVLLGGVLVGGILYSQIQNRYVMGQNNGYVQGKYEVFEFLEKNVQNDLENAKKESDKFLDLKASRLQVVEINGIKTIFLQN